MHNDGRVRVGSDLKNLEFAADVKAPTSKRAFRWDKTSGLILNGATADLTTDDTPTWEMLVALKAYAKDNYIRGIREQGGEETFHVFPVADGDGEAQLDPTYMQNLRHAQTRDGSNPLFSGSTVKVDGLYLHEHRHVYNTRGAATGSKWGRWCGRRLPDAVLRRSSAGHG